jgi:hypothetical protein
MHHAKFQELPLEPSAESITKEKRCCLQPLAEAIIHTQDPACSEDSCALISTCWSYGKHLTALQEQGSNLLLDWRGYNEARGSQIPQQLIVKFAFLPHILKSLHQAWLCCERASCLLRIHVSSSRHS